jgi:hypothetical protein
MSGESERARAQEREGERKKNHQLIMPTGFFCDWFISFDRLANQSINEQLIHLSEIEEKDEREKRLTCLCRSSARLSKNSLSSRLT